MKTILYIGGFVLPDGNAAAHRVLGNAKTLKALGWEVIFFGLSKGKTKNSYLHQAGKVDGFEFYYDNYPPNFIKWFSYLISVKKM